MKFACKFFFYYLVVVLATIQCAKAQPQNIKGKCDQCVEALRDSWNFNGYCDVRACRQVAKTRRLDDGRESVHGRCPQLCDDIMFTTCSVKDACQNRGFKCSGHNVMGSCKMSRSRRRGRR